MTDHSHRN